MFRASPGRGRLEIPYDQTLSKLPDDAVKWVIAHELGHVASGVPCGSLAVGKILLTKIEGDTYRPITADEKEMHEFVADAIARAWGFWDEEEAWEESIQNRSIINTKFS